MSDEPLIYGLLPELYRAADAGALKALTELLDATRATVERDISGLYQDWFVETCDPGLLPYIAELVGAGALAPLARDPRALVADAIALGRRKGTSPATEHMLTLLTGWPVRVMSGEASDKAVVHVWPEPAHAARLVSPHPAAPSGTQKRAGCYTFHPMGVDCPLYTVPRPYRGIETLFVEHLDAPTPLARAARAETYSGAFEIFVEDEAGELRAIPARDLDLRDLGEWGGERIEPATGARAIVDPALGRFILLDPKAHHRRIAVSFGYAAPGDIGGGPYERAMTRPAKSTWLAYVHGGARPGSATGAQPPAFRTLAEALEAFRAVPDDGLIRILDSGGYEVEGLTIGNAALVCPTDPNAPRALTIEALSGEVPVLRGALHVHGLDAGMILTLSGLWFDGHIALEGEVDVRIEHCSLHPVSSRRLARKEEEAPAAIHLRGEDHSGVKLSLDACLTGPLDLAPGIRLAVRESVIDNPKGVAISGYPATSLDRATILGSAHVSSLEAVDTLFDRPVRVEESDTAQVRFCALPNGADLPRAADCVTDEGAWEFKSLEFGMPGYARLKPAESQALRAAASNGSEIGVFNADQADAREKLLRDRLADSLPVGMSHLVEWR